MLVRRLEPEVMDTSEDADDYDSMDHSTVNRIFVDDLLSFARGQGWGARLADRERPLSILDVGTGTALIPIELCHREVSCRVMAIDLAAEMLKLAELNIARAGFTGIIEPTRLDAKQLPFADGSFEAVISNSIVHHIPEPREVFAEMVRVLRADGVLFVRDLLRPSSLAEVDHLVETYAGQENKHSQQLFRDSLRAALTLEEVRELAAAHQIEAIAVQQTSDRHWTLVWSKERARNNFPTCL
jgi:ubiquinone/menaquinone biosynthesis C-methylase UbiE